MSDVRTQSAEKRSEQRFDSPVRVLFLGSGDAFGSGGRFQTCIAVTAGDERYLVDCGASSLIAMRRFGVEPNSVTAILLTHLHGDHYGGVPFFLIDAQLYGKRTAPLTILGPQGTPERIAAAMEAFFPGSSEVRRTFRVDFREWRAGERVAVGNGWATPFQVRHASGAEPFAIRLECGGRTVAYSGDTEWTEALLAASRDADLFVVESLFFSKSVKHHLDHRTLQAHGRELSSKRIILTHMGPEMLAHASSAAYETADDGKLVEL